MNVLEESTKIWNDFIFSMWIFYNEIIFWGFYFCLREWILLFGQNFMICSQKWAYITFDFFKIKNL